MSFRLNIIDCWLKFCAMRLEIFYQFDKNRKFFINMPRQYLHCVNFMFCKQKERLPYLIPVLFRIEFAGRIKKESERCCFKSPPIFFTTIPHINSSVEQPNSNPADYLNAHEIVVILTPVFILSILCLR